ncbi:antitoxin [Labrys sp. La1]|uniref:antitoxin n=1 Tax=Labrys sp. La1 TaxID=3404917 RepID=UPI003EBD4E2D
MPHYAKVFRSGNSQAVRLPKEFRFQVDEVEVIREGDALILRPRADPAQNWASLRAALELGFSNDFLADGCEEPATPDRPGLDEFFE